MRHQYLDSLLARSAPPEARPPTAAAAPPTTAAVLAVAASGSRVEPGSTRGGSVTPMNQSLSTLAVL